MESQCDNANTFPNPYNIDTGGYFGYIDRYGGGYLGGQAELLRVPYVNHLPFIIPESCELPDEPVVFLSDVLLYVTQ